MAEPLSSAQTAPSSSGQASVERKPLIFIHNFQKTVVTFTDMCELCGELIYGLINPAVRCLGCGFLAHEKCHESVRTECNQRIHKYVLMRLVDSSEKDIGSHVFTEKTFTSPEYCNICRKLLVGIVKQGVCCEVCKYSAHIPCSQFASKNCKHGFYSTEDASQKCTVHQWKEGNILGHQGDKACIVCQRQVGSNSGLTGFRCLWCLKSIHTACMEDSHICDLGQYRKLVMPPHCIVAGGSNATKLKYLDDENHTPLVVFINTKSGGQVGAKLKRKLTRILNPLQIFNLSEGPERGLSCYSRVKNKIIMACGGDGTVGWLLDAMDKTLHHNDQSPVFILPLGTGNDLARVLGWGGGYENEDVLKILDACLLAKPVVMDRWAVRIAPSATTETYIHPPKILTMNNYISIGIDAKISLNFHKEREANPEKFNSRARNKLVYGEIGAKAVFDGCPDLYRQITLECDGVSIPIQPQIEAVIVLNIPSYGGGFDLWANSRGGDFRDQSYSDKLLEVVAVTGPLNIGAILANVGTGLRLAQCSHVRITIDPGAELPVQVDGEPWMQYSAVIDVTFLNQRNMLTKK